MRRNRFHSLEVVLGVTSTARAPLVNLQDGGFVGNPPSMKMAMCHPGLLEVLVILPANPGHRLLEAGELVLEVLEGVHQDVQLHRLLANHLPKIVGLENGT